jgi:7-keto-8-aminopelargonate synthetase-like enzyme
MAQKNYVEMVYEVFGAAKRAGIWHLYSEEEHSDGRIIRVKGQDLINFGSCSYLGLDQDMRLKQGTIDAVLKYGTQVSSSRAYLSSGLYLELEELFRQIFGGHIVIAPTTTLGHLSSLPIIIESNHAVILDQSVHASIQSAVSYTKSKPGNSNLEVRTIRNNRLDLLEEEIKELRQKHKVIWYCADGIFSMYGAECPIIELYALMDKYEELHLYIDDAHGMSWAGKHGSGFVLSKVKLHERLVLTTSLHKAFGSVGGVIVCPTARMADRIKTCGDALCFSGPINPPMLGAGIASAKIHLSDEIYDMQNKLRLRTDLINQLITKFNLPTLEINNSPIKFIGMGQPQLGYNMVKRLMKDGFYVNLAIYPAVPVKCTGLRICSTLHQTMSDTENLMEAVNYHFPKVIEEENWTRNKIQRAFKLPLLGDDGDETKFLFHENLKLRKERTIMNISKEEWNSVFVNRGAFDWDGIKLLEDTFTKNPDEENNWQFYYYMIYDKNGRLLLATFFTLGIWKDDMFASEQQSINIEKGRLNDKYYLSSKVLAMGSLITEGEHLFLDKSHEQWKEALQLLLRRVSNDREECGAKSVVIRDIPAGDRVLHEYLLDQGFFPYQLPDNNIIEDLSWSSMDEFLAPLSKNAKRHLNRHVLKYEHCYEVEVVKQATDAEIDDWYALYTNVKSKSLVLNTYDLPKKLFRHFLEYPGWEVISLKLKPEFDPRSDRKAVAIIVSYKNGDLYSPLLVGLDYTYLLEYECYRQALFQAIKRAKQLDCKQICLAFTAAYEKSRFGAKQIPTLIYMDSQDNFAFSQMAIA